MGRFRNQKKNSYYLLPDEWSLWGFTSQCNIFKHLFFQADFADDEPTPEVLAIRFSNAENAKKFKFKFEESVKMVTSAKAKEIKDKEEERLSDLVKKVDIGNGEKTATETSSKE